MDSRGSRLEFYHLSRLIHGVVELVPDQVVHNACLRVNVGAHERLIVRRVIVDGPFNVEFVRRCVKHLLVVVHVINLAVFRFIDLELADDSDVVSTHLFNVDIELIRLSRLNELDLFLINDLRLRGLVLLL